MRRWLSVALLVCVAAPATAQRMNAEDFHRRASALKDKGALALLEKTEIDALVTEAKAASLAARNRRASALKAKKPARFCPPSDDISLSTTEFMDGLTAIPRTTRRRIDMTEAMQRIFAARYPCRR